MGEGEIVEDREREMEKWGEQREGERKVFGGIERECEYKPLRQI